MVETFSKYAVDMPDAFQVKVDEVLKPDTKKQEAKPECKPECKPE